MDVICICTKCHFRVIATDCDEPHSEDTGVWFKFSCQNCGNEGYICKRDYIKWLEVYKRRINASKSREN